MRWLLLLMLACAPEVEQDRSCGPVPEIPEKTVHYSCELLWQCLFVDYEGRVTGIQDYRDGKYWCEQDVFELVGEVSNE